MSENKKERTVEEIQKEYTELCAKAGHLQYSVFTLNQDLEMVNQSLRNLNFEAASAHQKALDAQKTAPAEAVSQ